jgi:hypothetical protein
MSGNTLSFSKTLGNKNGEASDIKKAKKIQGEVLEDTRTIQE